MKYLPIHKGMIPHLQVGTTIVHNGGGNRQGWVGVVAATSNTKITVYYTALHGVQDYTVKWFQENIYLTVKDIQKLAVFDGAKYVHKYATYALELKDLAVPRINHDDLKAKLAKPEPFKGKWLARSNALLLETSTNSGLKAAIALAVAEDPSRSFDIYHQIGTAVADHLLTFKEL